MTPDAMHVMNARRKLWPLLSVLLFLGLVPGARAAPGEWLPGPDAMFDNTFSGIVDLPVGGSTVAFNQSVVVTGWVVDRAAEGWAGIDDLHVYDGLPGQGTFLGQASFAQPRPDVAQALANPFWSSSGFILTLPVGSLAAGSHTLGIFAHTPSKGWWYTQTSFTIGPPPPPPSALPDPINVILQPRGITIAKTLDHYTIKGYALDPSATRDTGIDRVDVYMDELRGRSDAKFIGSADLGRNSSEATNLHGLGFQTSGYQIDFKPNNFDVGNHHVYVYAHSSITNKETLDTAGFNISATP
jgi:hypothetical protein